MATFRWSLFGPAYVGEFCTGDDKRYGHPATVITPTERKPTIDTPAGNRLTPDSVPLLLDPQLSEQDGNRLQLTCSGMGRSAGAAAPPR